MRRCSEARDEGEHRVQPNASLRGQAGERGQRGAGVDPRSLRRWAEEQAAAAPGSW